MGEYRQCPILPASPGHPSGSPRSCTVDWPAVTLNGKPLWAEGSEATVPLTLRSAAQATSPFRLPTDDALEPGAHWLRFVEWPRGRSHVGALRGGAAASVHRSLP